MARLLPLLGLLPLCLGSLAAPEPAAFADWARQHRPEGYPSLVERQRRSAVFERNAARIAHVNAMEEAKNGPLRLELNAFADLEFEEWRAQATGFAAGPDACGAYSSAGRGRRDPRLQAALEAGPLPAEVDWREPSKNPKNINAVTPAKNQGGCGVRAP